MITMTATNKHTYLFQLLHSVVGKALCSEGSPRHRQQQKQLLLPAFATCAALQLVPV
jgi:hypothetical protein